ncbi:exosome complex exonuclease RRP42, partial [Reticulomyxa filosa]
KKIFLKKKKKKKKKGNLFDLCICPKYLCWVLWIDCVILSNNGNVFDALFLGCHACLQYLELPYVEVLKPLKPEGEEEKIKQKETGIADEKEGEDVKPKITIDYFHSQSRRLKNIQQNLPLVLTFAIVKSKYLIVDPLLCEEICADMLIR